MTAWCHKARVCTVVCGTVKEPHQIDAVEEAQPGVFRRHDDAFSMGHSAQASDLRMMCVIVCVLCVRLRT